MLQNFFGVNLEDLDYVLDCMKQQELAISKAIKSSIALDFCTGTVIRTNLFLNFLEI